MPAKRRPVLRYFLLFSAGLVLALVLSGVWFYAQLKRSLPRLDGEITLSAAGLAAPVTIERDDLGVPTLRAASRLDAARALGFLHAQERFFQMDLARRRAAGELAELVGKAAVPRDKAARIHAFRTVARASLAQLSPHERALLDAYTAGVNASLDALQSRPFEYILLRATPAPWMPEDSILVAHAMWLDLQDGDAAYERSLAALRDTLGLAAMNFFSPLLAPDDAALDDTTAELPPIPGPRILDLRPRTTTAASPAPTALQQSAFTLSSAPSLFAIPKEGSNSIALSGAHTSTGAALLANDMHLSLRVPNTWYRASLDFPSPSSSITSETSDTLSSTSSLPLTRARTRVTGVTLPGIPVVIAGSNGHIAWGFTNSNTDTVDLVAITASDINREYYIHEGNTLEFEKRAEIIRVKGEASVTHEIPISPWGPVVGENVKGQYLALKWIAHDPAATNFTLGELETATTAAQAVAIAHRSGIPAQNILIADSAGTIAWTIAGKLPLRAGFDGRLPVTMSFGDRRWDGFVPESQIPVLSSDPSLTSTSYFSLQPAGSARLSTANQRLFGGEALQVLGDGGYEPPLRAARLQELIAPLEKTAPRDLLAVVLDDRATHLDRWRELLLRTVDGEKLAHEKFRAPLRAALEPWAGRASADSASYRLVRAFRRHVTARALTPIFARTAAKYPDFNFARLRYEPALWRLLEEKPAHLLDPAYATWDDLLAAAAGDAAREYDDVNTPWGEQNTARIQHPLSRILPGFLARYLDMPADPLPGDKDVPRVQTPDHGASERFIVSPGREADGIFHMPGGQSGHPLSPYYRAGHDAWVKGEPTPFLPGSTQHTLTLTP